MLAPIFQIFPNILQAFKLSAQHGGVEYVQGEVTQVLALQEWIFHYLCQVSFKICTNILSRQNRSCPQSSDSGEQKLRRKSFISTHIQPLGRQGGKFIHGIIIIIINKGSLGLASVTFSDTGDSIQHCWWCCVCIFWIRHNFSNFSFKIKPLPTLLKKDQTFDSD